jgi:hypothetical protein
MLGLPGARLVAQCTAGAWTAEAFVGSAWHLPMPLTVDLARERTRLRARYDTRPFADAPYYSVRAGYANKAARAVELELLHHKLYLQHPEPPVDRFEVSHGYNMAMVNGVWPASGWQLRVGLGLVIAHPEGIIAGRPISGRHTTLGGGYHIAGVTVQAALGRRYPLGRGDVVMTATPEAKVTTSWATVPIPGGRVTVPDISAHVLGGLGLKSCR